jgi:DNA invertase Pin-like site-specific DNA recombinase
MREVADRKYKVFQDKSYNGRSADYLAFQEMMAKIRDGGVTRVIVYRLDVICRSALEFSSIIGEFQKHGVELVSIAERLDTASTSGKGLLKTVTFFAQLERESIQQRVVDAYQSRSRKGFYMGGRVPYGFALQTAVIDGSKTSMFVAKPDEIEIVRMIYAIYSEENTTLTDVVKYLSETETKNPAGKNFNRVRIRDLIINPVYVKADDTIYDFFQKQGAEIVNDVSQFIGTNGAYLYTGSKAEKEKSVCINGHVLVIAPHEGFIDADTWIRCRNKCLNVRSVPKPVAKIKNTWLNGKIKCIDCDYALTLKTYERKRKENARHFMCNSKYSSASCDGIGSIAAEEIEGVIFDEMLRKLAGLNLFKQADDPDESADLLDMRMQAEQIEKDIEALIDNVSSASRATMDYINKKINTLDDEKKALEEKINQVSAETRIRDDTCTLPWFKGKWNTLGIDDKIAVVDTLIENIRVGLGNVEIIWRI